MLHRAVPKFMKRIKVRDYKDRSVFGVPLQVIVQRSGQPLPQSIQQAMRYLRSQCLDQVRDDRCAHMQVRTSKRVLQRLQKTTQTHHSIPNFGLFSGIFNPL